MTLSVILLHYFDKQIILNTINDLRYINNYRKSFNKLKVKLQKDDNIFEEVLTKLTHTLKKLFNKLYNWRVRLN
jgi:hypothetical protein